MVMIFVLVDTGVQVKAYERNPQETLRQKVNKRALKRQEVKERKKLVSEHRYNLDLLMDLGMCYVRVTITWCVSACLVPQHVKV